MWKLIAMALAGEGYSQPIEFEGYEACETAAIGLASRLDDEVYQLYCIDSTTGHVVYFVE